MKRIFSKLLGGALLFGLTVSLTSCDPYLDDILGEWSRPTPNPVTPSGGGGTATETSISIDATLSIIVGNADVTLTATVDPAGTAVTWSSDNTAAATVDETGKVHAVAAGTAKITAKAGDKEAVCNVTVIAYTMAANATSIDKGKLICTDGHIHANGVDAECTKDRVALICYVGNDAETSTTYKHGLALALKDASTNASWCSTSANCLGTQYDDATAAKTDMAGIANTDALVGTTPHNHGDNAAKAAREFKYKDGVDAGAHPIGTSDWFLPSAGQWQKMIDAAGTIEAFRGGFSGITGASDLQSYGYYKLSTEYDATKSWVFYFGSSGNWQNSPKTNTARVRACLAF